jgi:rod shape-determining protein MreD
VSQSTQLAIRLALVALATVLLQTAALSQLALFGATPDIVPLVVASTGLLCGSMTGAIMGFSVGLLVDVALLQTLGVSSLVCLVVGYYAGRIREIARDADATPLPLLVGAAGTLAALTLFSLLQFLLGVEAPVSWKLVQQILSTVLINALLALPVHAAVRRALGTAAIDERRRPRRRRPGLSPLIQP